MLKETEQTDLSQLTKKQTIKNQKITTKAKSPGKTPFADAIEEAVDFVRPTAGRRYLIVKAEDRKALLDELRQAPANAHVRIKMMILKLLLKLELMKSLSIQVQRLLNLLY